MFCSFPWEHICNYHSNNYTSIIKKYTHFRATNARGVNSKLCASTKHHLKVQRKGVFINLYKHLSILFQDLLRWIFFIGSLSKRLQWNLSQYTTIPVQDCIWKCRLQNVDHFVQGAMWCLLLYLIAPTICHDHNGTAIPVSGTKHIQSANQSDVASVYSA